MTRPGQRPAGSTRRRTIRAVLMAAVFLGTIAAGGCGSLMSNHAKTHFILQDLRHEQRAIPQLKPVLQPAPGPTVLISVNPASALYESTGIVFSRSPAERAYYQLASWSERPSRRLGLMVERRLVKASGDGAPLSSVALDTSGIRGDWLLGVRLIDLYHDTSTQPHRAVVTVELELIDWHRRLMIDRASFSATPPLHAEDADAAVNAMSQGVTSVIDQVEDWIERKALEAAAPRPGRLPPQ